MSQELITTPFGFDSTAAEVVDGIDLTGQARDRHRRRVGHRRRDRPSAGRGRRRGHPRRARHRRRRARSPPTSRARPATTTVDVAPLDLADRASIDAFVAAWDGPLHILVNNAGVMAIAGADRSRRRAGRCSSRPTTSATSRSPSACTTRSPRPGGARIVSVSSSGHLRSPVVFDDIDFARPRVRAVARLRPVEDGQRPVRGRGDPALGRRRHHRQRADARRHPHQPPAPRRPRRASSEPAQSPGDSTLKTPEQGAATSVAARHLAAARGHRRPLLRGLQRVADVTNRLEEEARGVAAYALDPGNAERLWEVSLDLL